LLTALLSTAALLLFGIGAIWWSAAGPHRVGPHEIAEMIAAHHLMDQPDQYQSDTMPDLAQAMPRIDFTPRLPESVLGADAHINGARYCSVADRIAMQLRLHDGGRRCTLYLAGRIDAVPADGTPYRTRIRDLRVTLWHEGDRFYGLAEPLDPSPSTNPGP